MGPPSPPHGSLLMPAGLAEWQGCVGCAQKQITEGSVWSQIPGLCGDVAASVLFCKKSRRFWARWTSVTPDQAQLNRHLLVQEACMRKHAGQQTSGQITGRAKGSPQLSRGALFSGCAQLFLSSCLNVFFPFHCSFLALWTQLDSPSERVKDTHKNNREIIRKLLDQRTSGGNVEDTKVYLFPQPYHPSLLPDSSPFYFYFFLVFQIAYILLIIYGFYFVNKELKSWKCVCSGHLHSWQNSSSQQTKPLGGSAIRMPPKGSVLGTARAWRVSGIPLIRTES